MNDGEKSASLGEIYQLGIKHNPAKIVRIAKQADGRIVFLKEGKPGRIGSGLAHILERYQRIRIVRIQVMGY